MVSGKWQLPGLDSTHSLGKRIRALPPLNPADLAVALVLLAEIGQPMLTLAQSPIGNPAVAAGQ